MENIEEVVILKSPVKRKITVFKEIDKQEILEKRAKIINEPIYKSPIIKPNMTRKKLNKACKRGKYGPVASKSLIDKRLLANIDKYNSPIYKYYIYDTNDNFLPEKANELGNKKYSIYIEKLIESLKKYNIQHYVYNKKSVMNPSKWTSSSNSPSDFVDLDPIKYGKKRVGEIRDIVRINNEHKIRHRKGSDIKDLDIKYEEITKVVDRYNIVLADRISNFNIIEPSEDAMYDYYKENDVFIGIIEEYISPISCNYYITKDPYVFISYHRDIKNNIKDRGIKTENMDVVILMFSNPNTSDSNSKDYEEYLRQTYDKDISNVIVNNTKKIINTDDYNIQDGKFLRLFEGNFYKREDEMKDENDYIREIKDEEYPYFYIFGLNNHNDTLLHNYDDMKNIYIQKIIDQYNTSIKQCEDVDKVKPQKRLKDSVINCIDIFNTRQMSFLLNVDCIDIYYRKVKEDEQVNQQIIEKEEESEEESKEESKEESEEESEEEINFSSSESSDSSEIYTKAKTFGKALLERKNKQSSVNKSDKSDKSDNYVLDGFPSNISYNMYNLSMYNIRDKSQIYRLTMNINNSIYNKVNINFKKLFCSNINRMLYKDDKIHINNDMYHIIFIVKENNMDINKRYKYIPINNEIFNKLVELIKLEKKDIDINYEIDINKTLPYKIHSYLMNYIALSTGYFINFSSKFANDYMNSIQIKCINENINFLGMLQIIAKFIYFTRKWNIKSSFMKRLINGYYTMETIHNITNYEFCEEIYNNATKPNDLITKNIEKLVENLVNACRDILISQDRDILIYSKYTYKEDNYIYYPDINIIGYNTPKNIREYINMKVEDVVKILLSTYKFSDNDIINIYGNTYRIRDIISYKNKEKEYGNIPVYEEEVLLKYIDNIVSNNTSKFIENYQIISKYDEDEIYTDYDTDTDRESRVSKEIMSEKKYIKVLMNEFIDFINGMSNVIKEYEDINTE